jgi:PIN domain nuclease of toxin-antitoxin system
MCLRWGFLLSRCWRFYALQVYELPEIHTDPFDRLLITQCQLEELPILTADLTIAQYNVNVIW